MGRVVIAALRALLVVILVAALAAQLWFFPTLAGESAVQYPEVAWLRWPVLAAVVLGIAAVEVALVAVWVLLSMVARDEVFSDRAFRWVNMIIAAAVVATVMTVGILALLVSAKVAAGGLALPLLALIVAGAAFALLMVVMKGLLRQAAGLTAELSEVI